MKAIYKGKLYNLDDDLNKVALIDPETGLLTSADYGDPDLIIDPTDDEINNIQPDRKNTKKPRVKDFKPPKGWEYFGKRDAWGLRQMRHIKTGITSQEWDKGR
jgi:hypothetical protein